jgi:hypothetical protein
LLSADLTNFPVADVTVEGFIDLAQTTGGYTLPLYQASSNINLVPGSGVNSVSLRPCSGRGLCRTMRERAAAFDGRFATRPPITYGNWDADKIQGCECDEGYGGYGCVQRTCPSGRDPTDRSPQAARAKNEQYVLQCQADGGYFSIFVMGSYTQPIPYDADPAYVQQALQALNGVGKVQVVTQTENGVPLVCGVAAPLTTSVWFMDYVGALPPMMLTNKTANTRMWPSGGTPLSLSTGVALLQMATTYTLVCQLCPQCFGNVYFTYGTSTSAPLPVMSAAAAEVQAAVAGLADFVVSNWPNVVVTVTQSPASATSICSATSAVTTQITLTSPMGNIPGLDIVDATYFYPNMTASAGLSFVGTGGFGPLYECSNQGFCDRVAGQCVCTALVQDGRLQYQATSSNGRGGPGDRGDCGYLALLPSPQFCGAHGAAACSGHGTCSNVTGGACTCYDGWLGVACNVKQCPLGPAWFDEAVTPTTAHQPAECSHMGICDRSTGKCTCRTGFTGLACEVFDCPRDPFSTVPCSGRGRCMSLATIASELHGLQYGSASNPGLYPQAWDGQQWYNCVCASKVSAGYTPAGDPRFPLVGPRGVVSGFDAQSVPLPGWSGYDCSRYNCPMGDTTSPSNPSGGVLEAQLVLCVNATSAAASNFTLTVFGEPSLPILGSYGAAAIEAAIEYPAAVGNVSVTFPHAHVDNITTACHPRATVGFLVTFLTEFGDLPAMVPHVAAPPSGVSVTVTVTEAVAGTNANLECGGPSMGVCDRTTGTCQCAPRQTSSNGTAAGRGGVGDCAYYDSASVTPGPAPTTGNGGGI